MRTIPFSQNEKNTSVGIKNKFCQFRNNVSISGCPEITRKTQFLKILRMEKISSIMQSSTAIYRKQGQRGGYYCSLQQSHTKIQPSSHIIRVFKRKKKNNLKNYISDSFGFCF